MSDLQEQLSFLRKKIARIDRRYSAARPASPPPLRPDRPARYFIDEWSPGEMVETAHGCHFETERLYEHHRRHGSMDIGSLAELPSDLLHPISQGEITDAPPSQWCFLDTETTGLAGGAGTYAFLIGVGRITPEGFRVRQFFMREHGEEASLLSALADHLSQFSVMITYNGKTYDQPLLETRYRMNRARVPFSSLQHFDLLFGARRLWNLRFSSCRLVELENQILGIEREGDLPGDLIPYVYFEYVRTGEALRLQPIFHHNALDILTLACFTGIVPWAFHSPERVTFGHGAEMVGLARWWRQAGNCEHALTLFRQAVARGLKDELLFRSLYDIALLEKKLRRDEAAIPVLIELTTAPNPFRGPALAELAKHYERKERNYAMALEFTRSALEIAPTEPLLRRAARLEKRLAAPKSRRLL